MASELELCPFCRGKAYIKQVKDRHPNDGEWDACCEDCGATIPEGYTEEAAIRDWNTRPAPAATDTGLETVGVTGVMPGSSGGFTQVVFRADDVPANIAVCLHSQAEGLLAAKEAERAEQWRLRREMEADRDTQKAIATSLETELAAERAKTERWHKKAMDAGVIVHSDGTTSHPMRKERDDLKAKLSAAQKALDVIFNNPRSETAILEARAVLGRKQ